MNLALLRHLKFNRRLWAGIGLIHLWWLLLSGNYLWSFWRNPAIAGADGSGHVAALQLYGTHIYPGIEGWLPEFFGGGMPFPVFYPPLFYWLGATLMRLGGIDATLATKLLITVSFAALPYTLFSLGRRLGLSLVEATVAVLWAGIIACGANAAALSGVGLGGLFEIGFYTQTLGFLWFCVWCGALPYARRSRAAAISAMTGLAAAILTNVHILPLVVAYGASWLIFDNWRRWRLSLRDGRVKILLINLTRSLIWLAIPVMVASIWLLPLIVWYPYALGQPFLPKDLVYSLGSLNITWVACAIVAWQERRRRPALAAICVALLLVGVASVTPIATLITKIPIQPWRVASGALLLGTLPVSLVCVRALREVTGGHRRFVRFYLAIILVLLAWFHSQQRFAVGALSASEQTEFDQIRGAMRTLPPGTVLVESISADASPGSNTQDLRDDFAARALNHQLAMDGRPVLWSVFREHAASAPFATAVRNLFSSKPEKFGINGLALQLAESNSVDTDEALRLARHLGVSYYLLRSPEQVHRLENNPAVRTLWNIGGWQLFVAQNRRASIEPISSVPVLAWVPAHFKNRSPEDFDLFNLGEQLAFDDHSDICVMWALSSGTRIRDLISRLPITILVIDPSSVPSRNAGELLSALTSDGSKLRILLLDDGSWLANQVNERRQNFASYKRLSSIDHSRSGPPANEVVQVILDWQTVPPQFASMLPQLWQTSTAYFPAWRTAQGDAVWLTGQGGMAMIDSAPPLLQWHDSRWRIASVLISFVGVVLGMLIVSRRP